MNDKQEKLVSIIGSSYFEPITVLLEKLQIYDTGDPSEVQAGHYVNGYASSICILSAICLESYVMRVRYINKANQKELDKMPVAKYLKSLYADFPFEAELNEVFILRDVLAHNHLLEINFSWDNEKGMNFHSANRYSSGNCKFKNYVNISNNTTKTLGLNVIPIKVCGSDVKKVLQTTWKILLFLENKNRNQCYVSHLHTRYKGEYKHFGEIIGMPETCT